MKYKYSEIKDGHSVRGYEFSNKITQLLNVGGWEMIPSTGEVFWTKTTREIHEVDSDFSPTLETAIGFYKEEYRDKLKAILEDAVSKEKPFDETIEIVTALGTEKYVHIKGLAEFEDGKCVKLFGIIEDVTSNIKEKLRNQLSGESFRLAFEYASTGMAIIGLEGYFVRSNISLSRIIGYTQLELAKQRIDQITFEKDIKNDAYLLNQVLEGKLDNYSIVKRLIHINGQLIFVKLSVSLVRDSLNNPRYFIYQFTDISAQKQAEEEAAKVNERLRLIIKGSQAGWWDWDLKEELPYFSDTWYEMLGYTSAEDKENIKSWKDISEDQLSEEYNNFLEHLLNKDEDKFTTDFKLRHKNGHYLIVKSNGYILKDQDGIPVRITGTDVDITEALEKERQFEGIFNSSFQFVGLLKRDGTIIEANNTLLKFANANKEDAIGKKLWASPCWPQTEEAVNRLKKSIHIVASGEVDRFIVTTTSNEGKTITIDFSMKPVFDEDGKVTQLIPEGRNISSQLKAQKALEESEARWKFALEGSGDGVWDWHMLKQEIYYSETWKEMLGYAYHEIPNHVNIWQDLAHPDDLETVVKSLNDYLDGKSSSYLQEYRIRHKDGHYIWVLDRGKIIEYNEDGKPTRMIGTHTDITNQKETEFQLKETISLVSNQNNRLLNFAHIVSHNLRSHSGNIHMLLDFMENEVNDDEKANLFEMLRLASNQLNETINNLNEVVAIQTNLNYTKHEKSLKKEVQGIINNLKGIIRSTNAEVNIKFKEDVKILTEPSYLESILLNLINNAIKYRSPHRPPVINIDCIESNHYCVLKVEDNGLGINLDIHKDKIFGMYKTFHGNKDARGIGLFITKSQIEAMGGYIEVESEVDAGTTFSVYFPKREYIEKEGDGTEVGYEQKSSYEIS